MTRRLYFPLFQKKYCLPWVRITHCSIPLLTLRQTSGMDMFNGELSNTVLQALKADFLQTFSSVLFDESFFRKYPFSLIKKSLHFLIPLETAQNFVLLLSNFNISCNGKISSYFFRWKIFWEIWYDFQVALYLVFENLDRILNITWSR